MTNRNIPLQVSVIIPAYNEEQSIVATVKALKSLRNHGHEVILVDAGSTDKTVTVATPLVDKVLVSGKGRARQMNLGAANASGNVFCFLHADTRFNAKAIKQLLEVIQSPGFVWARFDVKLSGKHIIFRLIERLMNIRSCITGIATGDQAITVSRSTFEAVGSFPDIQLMEDVSLSRRLKKLSRPVCLPGKVVTSSRRWEEDGILATVFLMWKLRLLFWLGISPDKLARLYR